MPATRPVTTEFTWDAARLRYRRAGRFVSARAVTLAVRRVIRNARAEMRSLADDMTAGKITLTDWRNRFGLELKNMHVAAAMAGQGGPANMMPADYLRVGRRLKREYRFLDRLASQAAALPPKTVRARAEMYVVGMNGSFEDARREAAIDAGYTQERNILGASEKHCKSGVRPGCEDLSKLGWQTIGTMTPVGMRQCLSNCLCRFRYRRMEYPKSGGPARFVYT